MAVSKSLYYTKQHEWVKVDGDFATIGISDYAQGFLGEITFVELPEVGMSVEVNGELSVVESSKAASDVYAPVSGEVTEANDKLDSTPELINNDCYEDGWICKIKLSNPSDVEDLLSTADYEAFLETIEE